MIPIPLNTLFLLGIVSTTLTLTICGFIIKDPPLHVVRYPAIAALPTFGFSWFFTLLYSITETPLLYSISNYLFVIGGMLIVVGVSILLLKLPALFRYYEAHYKPQL